MKNRLNIRRMAIVTVAAAPLLFATGCSLFSEQASKEIDPPPVGLYDEQYNPSEDVQANVFLDGELEAGQRLTLYMRDPNGYVAPVTLGAKLGEAQKLGELALAMMVEGSEYESSLPEGFHALLPQGTQVIAYNEVPEQKMAVVDFSGAFADYNPQDERKILEAITWTLTGLDGIDQVEIWQDGEQLNEMPVDGFPLDEPLSRAMGINLEKQDGVAYSSSTPVTLYFSSETIDAEQYYVPVTRLITRTGDQAVAALEQLIAGPLTDDVLRGVMTPDIQVSGIERQDSLVTVDLVDEQYQAGQRMPAEMLEAVILSITENTGAEQVQIRMNGQSDVQDTDNRSYAEPVERPDYLNAFKL